MANFKKIDKRDGKEGFAIVAGEGFATIVQGGNGLPSSVITLTGGEQFELLAALTECLKPINAEVTA